MSEVVTTLGHRAVRGLFTISLVMLLEALVTIEWSFPSCSDPWDGSVPAVFGAPLPYERWAGSSLEYAFMPHLYCLNLALLFVVSYPVVRHLADWSAKRWLRITYFGLGICGVVLGIAAAGMRFLTLGTLWHPVGSISIAPTELYRSLRPIRVTVGRHYQCSPSAASSFWFGSKSFAR